MIGEKLEKKVFVTRDNTAEQMRSGDCPVYATPMMICEMENISATLAGTLIEPDKTTVGIKVDVAHLAPTPIGMEILIQTELIAQTEKTFEFKVSAQDKAGVIGTGIHIRAVVDKQRFIDKANKKLTL